MTNIKHPFRLILTAVAVFFLNSAMAQTLTWKGTEFEMVNVKATLVEQDGEELLRVERDLKALPFDPDNMIASVDEPTFLKIRNLDIRNGMVEVKILSQLLADAPPFARGFIGIAYRINDDISAYESIYIRPANGRVDDQLRRNHTVQYYAYPDYKFDRLREPEYKGQYETYADIGLGEWITLRIEFHDKSAKLYLNDQEYPSFIVDEMLGESQSGSIGLWVEIGTEGFFKDLKIDRD